MIESKISISEIIQRLDENSPLYVADDKESADCFREFMDRLKYKNPLYRTEKEMEERWQLFSELMQRTEKKNDTLYFTTEEMIFLGYVDLVAFGKKFPNEAWYFMDLNI